MTGPAPYVLVVGQPGPDRAWAEETLLRAGLVVATASEAELLVARDLKTPALVVQDDAGVESARMAQMNRLLAHPRLRGAPILVLGYDTDVESYTSTIRQAAAYLVKPVNPEELVDAARRLVGWVLSNEETGKRVCPRRPLIMKIEVRLRAQKRDVPGRLVDVAGGGCRIELAHALAAGDLVRVVLHTRDASTHVALGAEVRWCRASPPEGHVAGLQFTGTTAVMAGRLLGFVASEAP